MQVTGSNHPVVGPIIRGEYQNVGTHHGKPVFKKTEQVDGVDVCFYFWDGADYPQYCGWWVGPSVGHPSSWAFKDAAWKQMPPRIGWRIPYNASIDESVKLSGAGIGQCCYVSSTGERCPENAADDCKQEMCGTHCDWTGKHCRRHEGQWQQAQDALTRAERAPRRRGGKRKWAW